MITVISCGRSNGTPPPGDLTFDCSTMPDPSPIIQDTPGTAPGVLNLIADANPMVSPIIRFLIQVTMKLCRVQEDVTVVLVCSAGWHRSVACAQEIGRVLELFDLPVQVIHRDLVVKQ